MRFRSIHALIGAAFIAAPAFADITSETQNFAFPLSPGDTTLQFARFDDMGGTRELCKVTISFEGLIGAQITAENESTLPAPNFAINLTGFLTIEAGNPAILSDFAAINQVASQALAPSDGVDGSGPDFHDFGFISDSIDGMDMTTDPADFAQFLGAGTVPVEIFATAGFSASGTTDSRLVVSDLGASGRATITYEYKVVPAPASVALMGLGGLVATRRRR
ncbi:MAG: PEP-CTERM sorting domain-containing protein [Phycisphaerales bacterium]|jgi:hypothetical protein|nr:PEP-CTERM sorting domain-containing protein [Phycisphaerales bacterium]